MLGMNKKQPKSIPIAITIDDINSNSENRVIETNGIKNTKERGRILNNIVHKRVS